MADQPTIPLPQPGTDEDPHRLPPNAAPAATMSTQPNFATTNAKLDAGPPVPEPRLNDPTQLLPEDQAKNDQWKLGMVGEMNGNIQSTIDQKHAQFEEIMKSPTGDPALDKIHESAKVLPPTSKPAAPQDWDPNTGDVPVPAPATVQVPRDVETDPGKTELLDAGLKNFDYMTQMLMLQVYLEAKTETGSPQEGYLQFLGAKRLLSGHFEPAQWMSLVDEAFGTGAAQDRRLYRPLLDKFQGMGVTEPLPGEDDPLRALVVRSMVQGMKPADQTFAFGVYQHALAEGSNGTMSKAENSAAAFERFKAFLDPKAGGVRAVGPLALSYKDAALQYGPAIVLGALFTPAGAGVLVGAGVGLGTQLSVEEMNRQLPDSLPSEARVALDFSVGMLPYTKGTLVQRALQTFGMGAAGAAGEGLGRTGLPYGSTIGTTVFPVLSPQMGILARRSIFAIQEAAQRGVISEADARVMLSRKAADLSPATDLGTRVLVGDQGGSVTNVTMSGGGKVLEIHLDDGGVIKTTPENVFLLPGGIKNATMANPTGGPAPLVLTPESLDQMHVGPTVGHITTAENAEGVLRGGLKPAPTSVYEPSVVWVNDAEHLSPDGSYLKPAMKVYGSNERSLAAREVSPDAHMIWLQAPAGPVASYDEFLGAAKNLGIRPGDAKSVGLNGMEQVAQSLEKNGFVGYRNQSGEIGYFASQAQNLKPTIAVRYGAEQEFLNAVQAVVEGKANIRMVHPMGGGATLDRLPAEVGDLYDSIYHTDWDRQTAEAMTAMSSVNSGVPQSGWGKIWNNARALLTMTPGIRWQTMPSIEASSRYNAIQVKNNTLKLRFLIKGVGSVFGPQYVADPTGQHLLSRYVGPAKEQVGARARVVGTLADAIEHSEQYDLTPSMQQLVDSWQTLLSADVDLNRQVGVSLRAVDRAYVPHTAAIPDKGLFDRVVDTVLPSPGTVSRNQGLPSFLKERSYPDLRQWADGFAEQGFSPELDIFKLYDQRLAQAAKLRSDVIFSQGIAKAHGIELRPGETPVEGAVRSGIPQSEAASYTLLNTPATAEQRDLREVVQQRLSGARSDLRNKMAALRNQKAVGAEQVRSQGRLNLLFEETDKQLQALGNEALAANVAGPKNPTAPQYTGRGHPELEAALTKARAQVEQARSTMDQRRAEETLLGRVAGEPTAMPGVTTGMTRLYRGDSGVMKPDMPDWQKADAGRWFTDDPKLAVGYGPVHYVDVPTSEVANYHTTLGGRSQGEYILPQELADSKRPFAPGRAASEPAASPEIQAIHAKAMARTQAATDAYTRAQDILDRLMEPVDAASTAARQAEFESGTALAQAQDAGKMAGIRGRINGMVDAMSREATLLGAEEARSINRVDTTAQHLAVTSDDILQLRDEIKDIAAYMNGIKPDVAIPQSVGTEISTYLTPRAPDTLVHAGQSVVDFFKSTMLSADLSAQGLQGYQLSMMDPMGYLARMRDNAIAVASEDGFMTWMSHNPHVVDWYIQHGGQMWIDPAGVMHDVGGATKGFGVPGKTPIIGQMRMLDDVTMGRILPMTKVYAARSMYELLDNLRMAQQGGSLNLRKAPIPWLFEHTPLAGMAKWLSGDLGNMTDEQLSRAAVETTNNIGGGIESVRVNPARGPGQKLLLDVMLLSENWFRANMGVLIEAGNRGDPRGVLARRFLMQQLSMTAMLSTGMSLAGGQGVLPNLNPTATDFLDAHIGDPTDPNGAKTFTLLPNKSYVRTFFRELSAGLNAAGLDTGKVGLADQNTAGPLETLFRFGGSRGAQALNMAVDLKTGTDFTGRKITNYPLHVIEQVLPTVAQEAIDQYTSGNNDYGLPIAAQILGHNVIPVSPFQARDEKLNQMAEQGTGPHDEADPKRPFITKYTDLAPWQQANFDHDNPEYARSIMQYRADREMPTADLTALSEQHGMAVSALGKVFAGHPEQLSDEEKGLLRKGTTEDLAGLRGRGDKYREIMANLALYYRQQAAEVPGVGTLTHGQPGSATATLIQDYYTKVIDASAAGGQMDFNLLDDNERAFRREVKEKYGDPGIAVLDKLQVFHKTDDPTANQFHQDKKDITNPYFEFRDSLWNEQSLRNLGFGGDIHLAVTNWKTAGAYKDHLQAAFLDELSGKPAPATVANVQMSTEYKSHGIVPGQRLTPEQAGMLSKYLVGKVMDKYDTGELEQANKYIARHPDTACALQHWGYSVPKDSAKFLATCPVRS